MFAGRFSHFRNKAAIEVKHSHGILRNCRHPIHPKPRPNGCRSLRLIVSVPVYFADQKKVLLEEMQIHTIAMDLWASLEHQLKYKQEIDGQQEIVQNLRDCADTIAGVDSELQQIRERLGAASDKSGELD